LDAGGSKYRSTADVTRRSILISTGQRHDLIDEQVAVIALTREAPGAAFAAESSRAARARAAVLQ
jgi:hypothetical protein